MGDPSPEQLDPLDAGALRGALPDDRVAHNETIARRVNEAIEDGRVSREGVGTFVCECGQLGCNAMLELSLQEYESLRSEARQFVVAAGHDADFDRAVSQNARYVVVVKQGRAGLIAELTDPRAEDH